MQSLSLLSVQKCSDTPKISAEMVGKTLENSSVSACMLQLHSTGLALVAIDFLKMHEKLRKKFIKACAITKRQPESNRCAVASLSHGLSRRCHFYRLKGFPNGFTAICRRAQFGKSSVLVKHLMELKLKWPLFSRVNNFPGERNYLRTLLYFRGGKKMTVWGSGDGERRWKISRGGNNNTCL